MIELNILVVVFLIFLKLTLKCMEVQEALIKIVNNTMMAVTLGLIEMN